jgi:hypothetical protein
MTTMPIVTEIAVQTRRKIAWRILPFAVRLVGGLFVRPKWRTPAARVYYVLVCSPVFLSGDSPGTSFFPGHVLAESDRGIRLCLGSRLLGSSNSDRRGGLLPLERLA